MSIDETVSVPRSIPPHDLNPRSVEFGLPDGLYETLAALAMVGDVTVGDEVRGAVAGYVQARRDAPDFSARVAAARAALRNVPEARDA